jgi:ABC-type multidrug transport system fused ATPase/permease subunit
MAKNLIPEELDALIKEYLTDGVLTDKERQVILKKAEGMGLDHDEIDLYLDAQVQKIDQATDAAVRRQKGKACPHCGAYVSQMTDKCPECGQYITPEATKELEEILDNLEEALVNMKSRKDFDRNKAIVERYERKARMYYSNHPKIKALLAEVDAEMKVAESKLKSAKRKETTISILKNRWLWIALLLVIAILMMIIGNSMGRDGEMIALLGFLLLTFVAAYAFLFIAKAIHDS